MLDRFAAAFGGVRSKVVREKLHFARSVGKRLDEHREVTESIVDHGAFFQHNPWAATQLATKDDYHVRLYHMVHGCWPDDFAGRSGWQSTGEFVRPRPAVLGPCHLSELTGQGRG